VYLWTAKWSFFLKSYQIFLLILFNPFTFIVIDIFEFTYIFLHFLYYISYCLFSFIILFGFFFALSRHFLMECYSFFKFFPAISLLFRIMIHIFSHDELDVCENSIPVCCYCTAIFSFPFLWNYPYTYYNCLKPKNTLLNYYFA
jgi:hypothetical protein